MKTVIAIVHDRNDAANRCCDWLVRQGYRLEVACPADGDALPALREDIAGTVIFGGRYDVTMKGELPFLRDELHLIEDVLARHMPFLGICLGGQLLAHVLGEPVDRHPDGYVEYGYYELTPTAEGRAVFGDGLKVLQSHWHGWYHTPRGAVHLAASERFPQQAFRYGSNAYGLQFHPEATRDTILRWNKRRPPERYGLPGAQPPEAHLAGNLVHDAALAHWFDGFLNGWIGPAEVVKEAAE